MQKSDLSAGKWLNPPPHWEFSESKLLVTTGDKTDFWRKTHYGFVRDNGHFLGLPAPENFTATLRFEAAYKTLYDQAGLMLRIDDAHWLKFGVEHSDGLTNFSIVVTDEQSDWSVVAQPLVSGLQTVRLTRKSDTVIAHFQNATDEWQLMRVAPFPKGPANIGPMTCTPERSGLTATFRDLYISNPIDNALHT